MIDIHSHFFPRVSRAEAFGFDAQRAPWLEAAEGAQAGQIMLGDKPFRPVHDALWDPDARVRQLDLLDVRVQLVCATPVMFGYGWDLGLASEWAAAMNTKAQQFCAKHPKRLFWLAQVPLQDTPRACDEAARAMRMGAVGVQIGNHVGSKDLDHPDLVDFLIFCANNAIPVFVHPWDMMGGGERMRRWMLPWLVAMPAETQLGMLSLILSGALERIPPTLKICFAHGGGSFAYTLGRVDNAWKHRDIVRQDCPELPSSYVHRLHVDSAVFDLKALELLVGVMGVDRVMLGSDAPFPLGEQQPGALIRSGAFLSDADRQRLLASNAVNFFGARLA